MSIHGDDERDLESRVHRLLGDLPQRRAPSTLEERVLRGLQHPEERAPSPITFAHWSPIARIAFVVASLITAVGSFWASSFDLVRLTSLGELVAVLGGMIPAAWLYIGFWIGAGLYGVLFGLGALAFLTLYRQPAVLSTTFD